jgi:hypothetical protein
MDLKGAQNMLSEKLQSGVTVSIVDDDAKLEQLESSWNELFVVSPSAAPGLRWNWVRQWWQIYGKEYGDGGRGLRIFAVWRGARLIGVLPLYLGRKVIAGVKVRRLIFISTGAAEFEEICTEYLDLLYAPGEDKTAVQALAPMLRPSPALPWDKLELSDMSQASPLARLADGFTRLPYWTHDFKSFASHLFDMTEGFDGYTRQLSAGSRRNVKRVLQQVENCSAQFEVARDAETADVFFNDMIDLHRKRWNAKGKHGSFAPRHAEFHRSLARAGAACGDVGIARLSYRDHPLAVVYGHRVGEKFHCFQQGVDTTRTAGIHSPGNAAWFLLMKFMAERGVAVFDHLRGTSTFKERFGTGTAPLFDLRITRVNARTAAYAAAELSLRAVRKLLRATKRNATPTSSDAQDDSTSEPRQTRAQVAPSGF